MLLGRGDEQATVARLLADARCGSSGALIVKGEPGIGKSSLLQYSVHQAQDMTLLRATGIESESELPFCGLSELLIPRADLLDQIPPRQAAGLAGALALGPPSAADRLTIYAATLSLISKAAESKPVLAVIDDLHWLDAPSREALLFAARRLHADRVAMLFAVRTDLGSVVAGSGIAELNLSGVNRDATRMLLAKASGSEVSDSVAEQVRVSTGGNPLAISEISRLLNPSQLSGTEPLGEPLPTGPLIQRAFERQIALLPQATQLILLVVAASHTGSAAAIRTAACSLGLNFQDLRPAEDAGLVSNDGHRIWFRHPLIRAAAYHRAISSSRRRAHQALAVGLGDTSLAERAWHLAASAEGEDEEIASVLEAAADDARSRAGHAAASVTFERAARLSPNPETRARRLLEAASDAHVAGSPSRGIDLLGEALACTTDLRLRADLQHTLGRIEMWSRSPAAARKLLLAAVASIENVDPARAALILVDAATTCLQEGDPEEGVLGPALRISERAYQLAKVVGGTTEGAAAGLLGKTHILLGRLDEGYPLLMRCQAVLADSQSLWEGVQLIQSSVVFLWLEEFDRARALLESFILRARSESALGALPYPLGHLSEVDYRTGRWVAAYTGAAEAATLAKEMGQTNALIYSLICLGWVEAAQGREAECREHISSAVTMYGPLGVTMAAYGAAILGLLALGQGRNQDAINALKGLEDIFAREHMNEPALFQSTPNLIEAYIHVGQREQALSILSCLEEQAQMTRRSWALATVARCKGLLEDRGFDDQFREALTLHERTPTPFERARTELCYGERLRRARRRAEARVHLHSALDVFDQLGASCWSARTRQELRATGEPSSAAGRGLTDELTLQELQVALKVSEGATNREVAAALFLSPKTVEVHLSHVYSKLGIRSRTELAHQFAGRPVVSV